MIFVITLSDIVCCEFEQHVLNKLHSFYCVGNPESVLRGNGELSGHEAGAPGAALPPARDSHQHSLPVSPAAQAQTGSWASYQIKYVHWFDILLSVNKLLLM